MAEKKIPSRSDIDRAHQWDLAPLFADIRQWDDLYAEVEGELGRYDSYRSRLHESLDVFRAALEFTLSMSRRIERLYTYAHLKSDEDRGNQEALARYQRAVSLYTRISQAASFLTPEIQSLPEERIKGYMDAAGMEEYRFFLEDILRAKPHTRTPEVEEIMAMTTEMAHTASEIFSQLDNVDFSFGTVEDDEGNVRELSHGNFGTFMLSPSRELRKKVFHQYYRTYDAHKNALSTSLAQSGKKDVFFSQVRRFDSVRSASLFADNIPEEVYDNLVAEVRGGVDPLFDYLRYRREALGLDELHFYDTYVPIVADVEFSMSYEEAVATCIEALAPLGADYTQRLEAGLRGGWVDRYENRGKRSGAYSSGCYDSPPYILTNYDDKNINSLFTLIHEAGHSMHTLYSCMHQPYVNHDYTIFVAEVASTFNETLLARHLLERYRDDPRMQAWLLNREIDNIRATLYRQTMFAEFEHFTHREIEEGRPLVLDGMRAAYGELLKVYFGDTLTIDDDLTLEALRIPHFYSAFYVYKYATGVSAAIALAERVLNGGEQQRDAYLRFLGLGGSKYPLDELVEAGVDMRSPEPIRQAISHFATAVDRLRSLRGD